MSTPETETPAPHPRRRLTRWALICVGLVVATLVLNHLSLIFIERPVTLLRPPKTFLLTVAYDEINKRLDESEFTLVDNFDDRDVGVFAVVDWAQLDELDARALCGPACEGDDLLIVRRHRHKGLFGFRKDVFINAGFFFEFDLANETVTFTDSQIACLVDTMRLDILRANNGSENFPPCLTKSLENRQYKVQTGVTYDF